MRESQGIWRCVAEDVAIHEKERVEEYGGGVLQKVWLYMRKRESRNMEEMFYRRYSYIMKKRESRKPEVCRKIMQNVWLIISITTKCVLYSTIMSHYHTVMEMPKWIMCSAKEKFITHRR